MDVDEAGEEWKVRGFLSSPHRQAEVQIWFNEEPVFIFSVPPTDLEERNSIETISLERLDYKNTVGRPFTVVSFISPSATFTLSFYKKVSGSFFFSLCWQCTRQTIINLQLYFCFVSPCLQRVNLSFDFPFYGHILKEITVTTGGQC